MSFKNTNILFDPQFPGNSNSPPVFPYVQHTVVMILVVWVVWLSGQGCTVGLNPTQQTKEHHWCKTPLQVTSGVFNGGISIQMKVSNPAIEGLVKDVTTMAVYVSNKE